VRRENWEVLMGERIRGHIRSNLIGYVALFVALSGTAYAANTISSADIIDNEVRNQDIRDGNVTAADLRTDSVSTAKIGDGQVRTVDVLNDDLTGADISESGLGIVPNADKLDGKNSSEFLRSNFASAERLFDDDAGHLQGWDPDAADTSFTIVDPSVAGFDSVVLTNVQASGRVCPVTAVGEGVFTIGCNLAPPGGVELHFVAFNP
jgi:hypothetical protein